MVGCGRGCHLPVQSAVAEYRESLMTQCVMHANTNCPHHMASGAFRGEHGTMFIASRRVLKGARRVLHP